MSDKQWLFIFLGLGGLCAVVIDAYLERKEKSAAANAELQRRMAHRGDR